TIAAWSALTLSGGVVLSLWPAHGLASGVGLMALLSTIGMLHPLIMAQGRGLIPPASRGRGLGLLNTFVFLGSALTSWAFGMIANQGATAGWPVAKTYAAIFLSAAAAVALALLAYLFSPPEKRH